jgi:flagellar hook-length control protein FliK
MKTEFAGLNLGAVNGGAGNSSAKADAAKAEDKPQFDRLMEKNAAHAKAPPSAGKRSEKPSADTETASSKASDKPERASRKPKPTEDWPPVALVSLAPSPEPAPTAAPASPLELAANAQAARLAGAGLTDAGLAEAGSVEMGSVGAGLVGAGLPGAGLTETPTMTSTTPTAIGDGISVVVTDQAQTAGIALATDAPLADMQAIDAPVTPAQATQPARAEGSNGAQPALQNLLSFAGHLAAGNAVAAVPEAVALIKDAVDALRSDGDAESISPSTNLMAASNSASPNGLARTATVNPLEAPMPDLHNEQFDDAVGSRLTWMAEQKIGHAHIKITPNDLGTVEVRLRLDGDRVHADFSSAQPEVRQALENSLPKLRDMLGQHGFQLAQADVGHRQDSRPSPNAPVIAGNTSSEDASAASEALLPRPVRATTHGLLDAYA